MFGGVGQPYAEPIGFGDAEMGASKPQVDQFSLGNAATWISEMRPMSALPDSSLSDIDS